MLPPVPAQPAVKCIMMEPSLLRLGVESMLTKHGDGDVVGERMGG